MTRRTDALHLHTVELRARSSSPGGRRTLRRLAAAGIDVGEATTLEGLVDRYHRDGLAKDGGARAMLEELLGLATSDQDAALCALVALRPALHWAASRVYGLRPADDDIAELVAYAWGAICDGPPKHGSHARRVVLVARSRARTAQRRRGIWHLPESALREPRVPSDGWVDPAERPEPLLQAAVGAGVLSRGDAELIVLSRVVGIPLAVLVHDYKLTHKSLLRRRQRAEAALRKWIDRDGRVR